MPRIVGRSIATTSAEMCALERAFVACARRPKGSNERLATRRGRILFFFPSPEEKRNALLATDASLPDDLIVEMCVSLFSSSGIRSNVQNISVLL